MSSSNLVIRFVYYRVYCGYELARKSEITANNTRGSSPFFLVNRRDNAF